MYADDDSYTYFRYTLRRPGSDYPIELGSYASRFPIETVAEHIMSEALAGGEYLPLEVDVFRDQQRAILTWRA